MKRALASIALLSFFSIAPCSAQSAGATVVRQSDPHSALVGALLVVRAGLDRQTMKQNGLAALVAESIVRTPVTVAGSATPLALEDAIAANGGSIRFKVEPTGVRIYVEGLAVDAPAIFEMTQHALAAPSFSSATLHDAKQRLIKLIAANQQFAYQVGLDMLSAASSTAPNTGMPSLGTPASLAQFGTADAGAFYKTYYRRGGAVLSAAGNIDGVPAGAFDALVSALPEGSTSPVSVHVSALHGSSREIVAHRDISSPWLIAQYPAPSIDSRDFGPMLVLAAFVKRTLSDIAQVPGVVSQTFASRSVGTVYGYDRSPARLVLYVNGGTGNPNRAFATALSIVNVLAATKLTGSIDEFKAEAAGDFATGATTLETRAWLAAVFARGNAQPDFFERTVTAISSTTSEDVQRVARTYLGNPTIALVLPREGAAGN